jgi:hypothetical protein
MDVRNSVLVVLAYVVLATTVALVAFVGYRVYIRPSIGSRLAADLATAPSRSVLSAGDDRSTVDSRAQRRQAFDDALARIEELRRLLEKRTALLREKSSLLAKKTAEYEALREETNQYFALMMQMNSQGLWDGAATAVAEQEEKSAESRAEMERLEGELARSDAADQTLEAALAEATWQLEQAYAVMADADLLGTAEAQTSVSSASTQVLTEIGAPASLPLAAALVDDRPEVRRWAAVTLGQMGANALAATDALVAATRDQDLAVRQAAQDALQRIVESDF